MEDLNHEEGPFLGLFQDDQLYIAFPTLILTLLILHIDSDYFRLELCHSLIDFVVAF